MGLFTPVWMTEKEEKKEKAIAAIAKIDDLQKLKEIIVSAPLVEVKCAALKQLSKQKVGVPYLRSASDEVFEAAIDEIKDQQILYKLYVFCHNEELFCTVERRYYIVSKITDQSLLRELLRTRYTEIIYICRYYPDTIIIDDQTLLDILTDKSFYYTHDDGSYDFDSKYVLAMIEKSMGKEGVITVAKGTPYMHIAHQAVTLIADRGWMKMEEISSDKNFSLLSRAAAAERIGDKSTLHQIALDDSMPLDVRISAVGYITDQEILSEIILSEEKRLSKLSHDASDYREQHELLRRALWKCEDYELVKRFCTNPGPMGDVHRWEIVSKEESPSYFVGYSRFTRTTRVMRCVCCGYEKTEVYELPASRNEDDTYD